MQTSARRMNDDTVILGLRWDQAGRHQQSRNGRVERQRTVCCKSRWLCTLQPMIASRLPSALLALGLTAACSRPGPPRGPAPSPPVAPPGRPAVPTAPESRLPPMAPLVGPLRLTVVYPSASDVIDARDSTFLFGSVGDGRATLTVNGLAVAVWPNGAWLAWVPVAPDSILNFALVARLGEDSATLTYPVRRVPRFQPAPGRVVWIDSNSVSPASRAWWPADEYLPLSVRAAEGASVRLLLPGGTVVPLAPDAGPADVAPGILAFDRDTANLVVPRRTDRYVGAIRGVALGASPGPLLGNGSGEQSAPACCMAIPSPSRRAGEPPGSDSVMFEAIIGSRHRPCPLAAALGTARFGLSAGRVQR